MDVKVGDEVILNNDKIAKVIKITPTGRIRIDKLPSIQFDKDGHEMGNNIWNRSFIRIGKEKEKELIKKNIFIKKVKIKLGNYVSNRENLSYEMAVKFYEIMEEGNETD